VDRNRVTVRYATAFAELASEKEILEEVNNDIWVFYNAMNTYHGFNNFISKPGTSPIEKTKRIEQLFSDIFHPLSMKFILLIFKNNREVFLKDILRNTLDMIRGKNNIIQAKLVTAYKFNDELMEKVRERFEQKIDSKIEMTNEMNPDIIGGFIFTIDGEQYDASVASKLKSISKQLQLK